MLRRPVFASLLALLLASSAWAKWKPEEQDYLDSHFKAVLDQVQALSKQIQALNARLNEMQQTQTQFQEVLTHHQRQLDNLDQMVSTIRLSSEQNFSTLKTMLNQMRAETQKSLSALGGRPTESGPQLAHEREEERFANRSSSPSGFLASCRLHRL